MKVAVTGGSGFLGQYVIQLVSEDSNFEVVSLGRGQNTKETNSRTTDYTVPSLQEALADVDAVVHLAAKRGGTGDITDFQVNTAITQNIYEACRLLDIENIIYASSISVYSNVDLIPWQESQIPEPRNVYGVSKLSGEMIGDIYTREHGLKIKNLRFAHIFGANEENSYMLNTFMRLAFKKETLNVFGEPIAKREFLYAKDAAKAVKHALDKKDISGTFNIGSGEAYTNLEAAELVNEAFDNEGNLELRNPDQDEGIQSSLMNSTKAKEKLSFTPDYTFSEALAEIHTIMKGN